MTNLKSLIVGAVAGVLSVLVGIGCAHAAVLDQEDVVISEQAAIQDAAEGEARGYTCEVIRLADGGLEAQCDEVSSAIESDACGDFVDSTYNLDQAGMTAMYEACMTIALHTPGAVR